MNPQFKTIQLAMDWLIPDYHASIITPDGEIYILGGQDSKDTNIKYNYVFKVNVKEGRLEQRAPMLQQRDSHAVCYNEEYLYVIGGLTLSKGRRVVSRECERYNIVTNKWTALAPVSLPVSNHCACVFQKKYIFCFGGRCQPNKLSNNIFKYTISKDVWVCIQLKMSIQSKQKFALTSQAACCQLNDDQVFVFGGYHENRNVSDQSFLFNHWVNEEVPNLVKSSVRRFEPLKEEENKKDVCLIKGLNVKKIVNAAPFWDKQIIMYKGKLFCLQNAVDPSNPKLVYKSTRKLLMFDGEEWRSLN